MPLFNIRKRAGSGAGDHVYIVHADQFAPPKSPLEQHFNDLQVARIKEGKKPINDNATLMKTHMKEQTKLYKKGKLNPPSTPDPFDY